MSFVTKKSNEDNLLIICNKEHIEMSLIMLCAGKDEKFQLVKLEETSVGFNTTWNSDCFGEIRQEWELIFEKDCEFNYKFRATFAPNMDIDAVIMQQFAFTPKEQPYFMIPGVLYGTNNIKNSKSIQPQLNYRGDIQYPKTPSLFTRADRSTHNAVISIFNNSVLGIGVNESTYKDDDPYYNGLGIDTRHVNEKDRICLTYGFSHFPAHYKGKLPEGHACTNEPQFSYLPFKKSGTYTATGQLFFGIANDLFAYEKVLSRFYDQNHQKPNNKIDRNQAINDIALALINDAYDREYKYFPTVLGRSEFGDTGWTGGMQVVYPLIKASVRVTEVLEVALDYIDSLVTSGLNEKSGFFYESKYKDEWKPSGWWKAYYRLYNTRMEKVENYHSAYVNGQATCYLLKSYRFFKKQGWQHETLESWLTTCQGILEGVISKQRYDGAFGAFFDALTGEVITYNSFQGAWFLAAIAELAAITGDSRYIQAFKKANSFYYTFLEKVELWGMPMDTKDAVDQEGNLAYVTALKTIHEVTGEKEYLDALIHALHYEFSWKFAYNTRHVAEPLKSLNWPSCGGSITSSHNIHIHQMGNLIAEEMYYAALLTKDDYIISRLKDTLNWGLGTYNREDNYFGYGKKGWATEQFFHTDGRQDDPSRVEDGGIWADYLSWAASCILLSCAADIPDEFYV